MQKPNILLITTDQQRFDHLGLKGLKAITTPNLDRLGTEGIHFDRAYCPSPICTPTRVSLLTGRFPSTHYAYSIGVTADPFPGPTIGQLMTEHGYATGLFGKTHFVRRDDEILQITGTRNPPPEFFKSWKGPCLGFQEFLGSTGHTTNNIPAMHYAEFLRKKGVDYSRWFPQMRGTYDHDQCGAWDIPAEFHDTQWVTNITSDFIRNHQGTQPWFAFSNFQDPHEPYVCPEPWYSRVDMARAPSYEGYRPGEFDDKPDIYKMALNKNFKQLNDGSIRGEIHGGAVTEHSTIPSVFGEPKKEAQKREALQATLGMIAFLDDRLGSILNVLEETGQIGNTIIIFTSDHGEMHGHHGLWGKGATAYEDCQRVPLLIWGPGLVEPRGTVSALANLVDLPATILGQAGIPTPQEFQGRDLTPILRGDSDSVQDATIIEMRGTRKTFNQHTLVTAKHKLVVYKHTDHGELYDLEEDPDQYRNLWDNPAFAGLKLALLHRLAKLHMEREPHGRPRLSFA